MKTMCCRSWAFRQELKIGLQLEHLLKLQLEAYFLHLRNICYIDFYLFPSAVEPQSMVTRSLIQY